MSELVDTRLWASEALGLAKQRARKEDRTIYITFLNPGYRLTDTEPDDYIGWAGPAGDFTWKGDYYANEN